MTAYICKCGQRVQKSGSADNTGNRLEGYGPGHECYGCPYAMPWGGNKWDEAAKRFVQDIKGYECRTSRTLSYDSHFIGSTKDKCTCAVVSLDFDFLEQISAWVKDTFPLGELTGGFSQDEIRPTDYSHNGRYCCTFVCASNKKGIAAKAALFARFFDPDGSRKDMTPQQEREKILADIRKCTQEPPAAEDVAVAALPPAEAAEPFVNIPAAPSFDFSALGDLSQQAADADQQFDLHYGAAQDEYLISCIYLARIHALTAKAGRYGGGTWTKWYESKGLSEGSARTMVKNGDAFNSATVAELKQLPELTRKDLNLIARSGCAGQLVETAGDSQRVQELLAQLKAEKERADTAEAERDKARADQLSTAKDCNRLGLKAEQEKARADKAEGERDEWKAEAEAARKQPIVGIVDKDEVARQVDTLTADAKAQARSQVEDAQRRANEAEAKYQKLQQDADGFLAPEQACELLLGLDGLVYAVFAQSGQHLAGHPALECLGLGQLAGQHQAVQAGLVDESGLGCGGQIPILGICPLRQHLKPLVLIIDVGDDGFAGILVPQRHGNVLADEPRCAIDLDGAYLPELGISECG